jgi:hypothetical protein
VKTILIIPASALGWIISWLFIFFIPAVEGTTCTQGNSNAWSLSLAFCSPISIIYFALIYIGIENRRYLKWLSLPHAILIPVAAYIAFKYLWGCTILGHHVCYVSVGGFEELYPELWQRFWAPVQLLILSILVVLLYFYWRPIRSTMPRANKQINPTGNNTL